MKTNWIVDPLPLERTIEAVDREEMELFQQRWSLMENRVSDFALADGVAWAVAEPWNAVA